MNAVSEPDEPRRYTILLVDDDPADQMLYRATLQISGEARFNTVEATSGAQALRIVAERHFDCVFLDQHLPDARGTELIEALRDASGNAHLPIIMLTGVGNEKVLSEAQSRGISDYMPKRLISPDALYTRVAAAVAGDHVAPLERDTSAS